MGARFSLAVGAPSRARACVGAGAEVVCLHGEASSTPEMVSRELQILQKVSDTRSKFVVQFVESFVEGHFVYMVTVGGGSFGDQGVTAASPLPTCAAFAAASAAQSACDREPSASATTSSRLVERDSDSLAERSPSLVDTATDKAVQMVAAVEPKLVRNHPRHPQSAAGWRRALKIRMHDFLRHVALRVSATIHILRIPAILCMVCFVASPCRPGFARGSMRANSWRVRRPRCEMRAPECAHAVLACSPHMRMLCVYARLWSTSLSISPCLAMG